MFLLNGSGKGSAVVWTATDLVQASACEYRCLMRVQALKSGGEPIGEELSSLALAAAHLGRKHETQLLTAFQEEFGEGSQGVVCFERAASRSRSDLQALHTRTLDAMQSGAQVLYQPGVFDGEFYGYADFLIRSPQGWIVADAKLAKASKPEAVLQIAAYAQILKDAGVQIAPMGRLYLGDGVVEEFEVFRVAPVFRERRKHMRELIQTGWQSEVSWGGVGKVCGQCTACEAAIATHDDLLQVAGIRKDQRRKLREIGIETLAQLGRATAGECPATLARATFDKLRLQAEMQLWERESGCPQHRVKDPGPIQRLPAPDAGDIFFDFEGDPLFAATETSAWGLEFLWGWTEQECKQGYCADKLPFRYLWVEDSDAERQALVSFLDYVVARRKKHPAMHIYHYAPYEVSALKRLVVRHQTHAEVLDELLRANVFVDLYATVRGSLVISKPSYSIKKLEAFYMQQREEDVQAGDDAVAEFQRYLSLTAIGDDAQAKSIREGIIAYNEVDCRSTLLLRDWLLELVNTQAPSDVEPIEPADAEPRKTDPLNLQLLNVERLLQMSVANVPPEARSADQQGLAMASAAMRYYNREVKPFFWEHYSRLNSPMEAWPDQRDVFIVDRVIKAGSFAPPIGRKKLWTREVTLRGRWGDGSQITAKDRVHAGYAVPVPRGLGEVGSEYGVNSKCVVTEVRDLANGHSQVVIEEQAQEPTDGEFFEDTPVFLSPGMPIPTRPLQKALADHWDPTGQLAKEDLSHLSANELQQRGNGFAARAPQRDTAFWQLLTKQLPRFQNGYTFCAEEKSVEGITRAIAALEHSYLAVQGPPGTGKTWAGGQIIAKLAREYGWKIGIVAQSHAVIENMLYSIINNGKLDPQSVWKVGSKSAPETQPWRHAKNIEVMESLPEGAGAVFGGTTWVWARLQSQLDLLVVDEAGQFSLANLHVSSMNTDRIALFGDPQQLPQVSQGLHPEPIDDSALGWLSAGHDTLPAEYGLFLDTTYRMHPEITKVVSHLAYQDKLHSASITSSRGLDDVAPGLEVIKLDHHDNSTSSSEEADEVLEQVKCLLRPTNLWHDKEQVRPLCQSDIKVVTPYNAQRKLIKKVLAQAGFDDIAVGTVDKFQGQEAPVVIISMAASSEEGQPRGMDFLLNRNRINVSISRAQWKASLIRSKELTNYMPTGISQMTLLGDFIEACGD